MVWCLILTQIKFGGCKNQNRLPNIKQAEHAVDGNVQICRLPCRALYRQLMWQPVDAPELLTSKKGPA